MRLVMNHDCWVEHELLLHCVWINVNGCIGVKVRLMNLHLLEGIGIKELHNAHLASTNGVAEETGNELLGIRGHLGLGILGELLGILIGLRATSIYIGIHFNFFCALYLTKM
jgi:hypothetical protein